MIEKLLALCAVLVLCFVLGTITYNEVHTSQVIVLVDLKANEDPVATLPRIMPQDSVITNIQTIDQSKKEYQLTITTKMKKQGLVDWLLKTGRVESAEIKE